MYVVALTELRGDLETEAAALAAELGRAAYDVKLRITGVLPRVLFHSASEGDASRVLTALRERGHGALVCDTRDVVPSGDMVKLHRFAFEETSLLANVGGGERLAYADIALIVTVTARTDVVRATMEKELVPRGTRGSSVEVKESTRHEHIVEHAAYVFPRPPEGERALRPWLLHEREAQYVSLGAAMRPTRHDNFLATIAGLRARAPAAIYDDRYAAKPLDSSQFVLVRGHESATAELTDAGNDLAVHLLATWLTREQCGPYR